MHRGFTLRLAAMVVLAASLAAGAEGPQSVGNSTTLRGTVLDATGAIILGATVKIHNPVSGLVRTAQTDAYGQFNFPNVPFNNYHLTVTAKGFAAYVQDVDLRSVVPGGQHQHAGVGRGHDDHRK